MRHVLLASALFGFAGAAAAGSLYRCVDKNGVAAYQETPCPTTSKGAKLGYVAPVKASPSNSWTAQRGTLQQQQAQRQRLYRAEVPRTSIAPSGPSAFEQDLAQARSDGAASAVAANDRARSSRSTTAIPEAPQGQVIVDQNLNRYYQQPSSAFATDQKTGKQCFVNGAFIHC